MAQFGVVIVAIAVVCSAVAVLVGAPPRSRRHIFLTGTLGALVGLAPISAVVFLRLSYKACAVLNLLGLPWAEPWRGILHWAAGVVVLASTTLLIFALAAPIYRRTGIAMLIWSAISALPTLVILFLIVYGDPVPGCVPV